MELKLWDEMSRHFLEDFFFLNMCLLFYLQGSFF